MKILEGKHLAPATPEVLAALRHRYGSDLTFEPLPADTYAERAHAAAAAVARQRGRRNP